MAAAGIIAMLRRQKAIDLMPATYRISDVGKNILSQAKEPKQAPAETPSEPKTEPETKEKARKSKQQEQGRGANP